MTSLKPKIQVSFLLNFVMFMKWKTYDIIKWHNIFEFSYQAPDTWFIKLPLNQSDFKIEVGCVIIIWVIQSLKHVIEFTVFYNDWNQMKWQPYWFFGIYGIYVY